MIDSANIKTIETACTLLKEGNIVALPTETVYGLAADATNESAVQRIFQIKGRPTFNPLIVHVLTIEQTANIGEIPPSAMPLLEQFWPGPLTIVVPLKENHPLAPSVTAGLKTIALRMPAHPVFQEVLRAYGKPLAAPSANASNTLSCTRAEHVSKSLGNKIPLIIEGNVCDHGLESTIVDFSTSTPTILRHGALSAEELGILTHTSNQDKIKAPGQLKRHYAPSIPLRLNVKTPRGGEAFLNFGTSHPQETLNLSPASDLKEAAQNLFQMLHQLDDPHQFTAIAVSPIPHEGIGVAINDRLNRGAQILEKDLP